VLARVFGEERADAQLERYHDVEPALEVDGTLSYREVMTRAMRELGADDEDAGVLADSLPSWEPFPETHAALSAARERGWKLAILSNTDRDFIEASMARIGVPFELAIELGLRTIWINRRGATAEPSPTRELPDLSALPDTLDELVPG
jgi:FMN phosphatase YigB (HAD superfamily)